jgi:hypothetical protein
VILFAFRWAACCLVRFVSVVGLSWHTGLDYGSCRLPGLEMGLTAGVTGRQGMLAPPWHLIPPLIYSEVCLCPFSDLYYLWDLWDWLLFVIVIFVISLIIYCFRSHSRIFYSYGDVTFAWEWL